MEPLRRFRTLVCLSFLPLAGAAALLCYLLSSEGTIGLLGWNPSYMSVIYLIVAAGVLPFAVLFGFALLSRRREGLERKRPGPVVRIAGGFLIALSTAIGLAMLAVVVLVAVHGAVSPIKAPNLNLLNKQGLSSWGKDGASLSFAFSSDPHFGNPESKPEASSAIIREVDAGSFGAFFVLGDLTAMGSNDGDILTAYRAFSAEQRVPLAFLMGNHDALVGAAPRFRRTFGVGNPPFRYDSGAVHVIALDLLWGTDAWSAAKGRSLEAALASIPKADAVIVVSHCFFWSSGYVEPSSGKAWFDHAETTKEIAPLLEKYGVDLVVSGHNHYMEFLEKGDTAYAVIGAMGGPPDPEPTYVSPYSKWFSRGRYGYLAADLSAGAISLRFVDEKGDVLFRTSKPVNR
jgi:hypothetical protein